MVVAPPSAQASDPVVRAVLFFSPTCGHCHYVIDEVLPGLFESSGGAPEVLYDETLPVGEVAFILIDNGRLQVLLVDVTVENGVQLFHAASEALGIESQGVPRLVVGDEVMIGSVEIPERFPAILADSLDTGSTIDWPNIAGVEAAVASVGYATSPTTTAPPNGAEPDRPPATLPAGQQASMGDRFRQDPAGNTISLIVLIVMVGVLAATPARLRSKATPASPGWDIPLLALAGLAVAGYLAFIEVAGNTAVCGPVGDCNTVQQSEYARLFGVLPIGVAGVAGYIGVIVAWSVARRTGTRLADIATVALLGGAIVGTLFSAYLTFLEPFVIGATCMWCITSALVITAILWQMVAPGRFAASRLASAR